MGRLPLWQRWALTLIIFGALVAVVVTRLTIGDDSATQQQDAVGLIRANKSARLVVVRDQAPHSAPLGRGIVPSTALEHAIAGDLSRRVRSGDLGGPVQGVRCTPSRPSQSGRLTFKCAARAGGFSYPYLAVADTRAMRLTWCKSDPAPAAQPVPVSRRCIG